GMGGRKIRSIDELPSDTVLIGYIREAVALNEQGVKVPRPTGKKQPPKTPPYLAAALKKNAKARRTFENFSPSQKRDYVVWLAEAKQEATRERRLATAIEWMAEGKSRNWKYQNC
ncbi:MAG: YdeI/OmpD-associated family protein, partial [Pseudomonadota bacterium]|nr:YdeI/OmpD-associated family protein [Pseudomonadota bacterium]